MLTLLDITNTITELQEEEGQYHRDAIAATKSGLIATSAAFVKRRKKVTERIKFYKFIKNYLETGPDPDGIRAQRNVLKIKLSAIEDRVDNSMSKYDSEGRKNLARHYAQYGKKKLSLQYKVLTYILK